MKTSSKITLVLILLAISFIAGYFLHKPGTNYINGGTAIKVVEKNIPVPAVHDTIHTPAEIIYYENKDLLSVLVDSLEIAHWKLVYLDSVYKTKAFIAKCDTSNKNFDVRVKFLFPEKLFDINLTCRPDPVKSYDTTKTITIIKRQNFVFGPGFHARWDAKEGKIKTDLSLNVSYNIWGF